MDEIIDADAAGAGETFGSLGGYAVLEGGSQRRASAFDLAIRLLVGQLVDLHGEAARCAIGTHLGEGYFSLGEALAQALGQSIGETVDGARWQFLDAEFDQKGIGGHGSGVSLFG